MAPKRRHVGTEMTTNGESLARLNSKWKYEKNSRGRPRSVDDAELGHLIHVAVLQTWTKIYNARVQLLFCSLNLLLPSWLAFACFVYRPGLHAVVYSEKAIRRSKERSTD